MSKIKRLGITSLFFSVYSIIIGIPLVIFTGGVFIFSAPFYFGVGIGKVLEFFIKITQLFFDNDIMVASIEVFVFSLISFITGMSSWKNAKLENLSERMELPNIAKIFCIVAFTIACINGLILLIAYGVLH